MKKFFRQRSGKQEKTVSNPKKIDALTIFAHTLLALILIFVVMLLSHIALIITASLSESTHKTLIRNPMLAVQALIKEHTISNDPYRTGYWYPPGSDKKGLVTYRPDRAFNGLTLYLSAVEPKAMLIDMEGAVVHEWSVPFPALFGKDAEGPRFLYKWIRCHLTPEGDLFVIYDGVEHSGLLKLDRNSRILWNYEGNAHHDIAVSDSGTVYTFSKVNRVEPHQSLSQIEPPFVEDFLVELDNNGNEISRVSLIDVFVDTPSEHVLSHLIYKPSNILNAGDLLHPNSIEIIKKPAAGREAMLAEGRLLLSFRNNSLLAILDPETKKITWASYGPWKNQHDPRFLDDGTVVLFDNEGWLGAGGASRILQVDLATSAVLWQYAGSDDDPLYSQFNSSVDPLQNGNILATQSMAGRLFEVTREGEIVWDYRTSVRVERDGEVLVPAFFRGRRFRKEDLPFLSEGQ